MVKMVSNELGHESDLDQEPERPELVATSLVDDRSIHYCFLLQEDISFPPHDIVIV